MAKLYECDRCGDHFKKWTHFGRRLPNYTARVKKGWGRGYRKGHLCRGCAEDLESFMRGRELVE